MATPRIVLTEEQRAQLRRMSESPTTSTRTATRARIVLSLERNWRVKDVSEALGVSAPTVRLWRDRFLDGGIEGLVDRHEATTPEAELSRLLDAAERTVSKRGFCATRVADIAYEAGVSTSLIVYYFESRQDILVRAMLHANQRAATEFELDLDAGQLTATARLAAFIMRVLPETGSRRDEYLLEIDLLAHARQFPEFISIWDEHQRRWTAGLARIIAVGVAEGSFRLDALTPHALAQSVLAMVDGFGFQVAIGSQLVTKDVMTAAIVDYVSTQLGVAAEVLGTHIGKA